MNQNPATLEGHDPEISAEKLAYSVSVASHASTVVEFTPEEERIVVRKIDTHVLPIMCLVFFCQYLDKQVLSYTAVFGLKTDLKLEGNQYSWLTSGFYLAQVVSQFWNSYALSKFPIKYVTGISVIVWGAICMCLAAPNNFAGFMAVRALLGFAEGSVQPSFVIITSLYYRKKEHPLRTACWISCNAVAQVFGNFLVYGIAKNSSIHMATWRVTFLVAGAMTIFAGCLFYFLVPFQPETAFFLTEREKQIARARILLDSDRGEKRSFSFQQLKESFDFDWITVSAFLFGFLTTATSGPIIFASLYLQNMGYDSYKVVEYGLPAGAVQLICIWVGVAATLLFPKERCYIIMGLIAVPLVGNILLLALPSSNHWGCIVGAWLGSCITSFMSIFLSLVASNTRGNTRKSIVNNVYFLGYDIAAIVYPQWWDYSKDPTYRIGLSVDVAFWVLLEAIVLFYRFWCIRENKRRDMLELEGKVPEVDSSADVTDKDDLNHRYRY